MDETFDLELSEPEQDDSGAVQLPVNILAFGEIGRDDVRVYIRQDVYQALERYARADTEHERGTVLLGRYCEELGKTHLIISHYIEAKYTDASASTLTFTHETWEYIHEVRDEKYPDEKIVGWQHTHPGYGIFLSNYDLFIQENFFNLPFQVAYVIDPVQNLRGFFQWKEGKIEKLEGYYLYDEVGKAIKIEAPKPEKEPEEKKSGSSRIGKAAFICMLLLAIAGIAAAIHFKKALDLQKQTIAEQNDRLAQLVQTVDEQEREDRTAQQIVITEEQDGQTVERTVTAEELLDTIASQQTAIEQQQETIDALSAEVRDLKEQAQGAEEYVFYTIQPGDTLVGICESLGIDYWKNRGVILGLNRIADENTILVGQVLVFPRAIVG